MNDEPMNDYLWDRTGDEDAELSDLERLLERFRHRQPLRRHDEAEPEDEAER